MADAPDPASPAEQRLDKLAQFVHNWYKDHQTLSLGKEDIEAACQGGYADGLTLSHNLKAVAEVFSDSDIASCENFVLKGKLKQANLHDKLLYQWYLSFFHSLELAGHAAKLAVQSEALAEANGFFNPSEFMTEKLSLETMKQFWVDAAPELAKAALEALQAKKTFTQAQPASKFKAELRLGDIGAFHLGLDGVIGLPKLNFLEAMRDEHEGDSEIFSAFNQGKERRTSPAEEWTRVLPDGIDGKVNVMDYAGQRNLCAACDDSFEKHRMVVQADLQTAEIVALRLYTSPMYRKYNEELRGLLEKYLELQQSEAKEGQDQLSPLELVEEARRTLRAKGVKYVTTIHAIASGLIKLSKHSGFVDKVYRGIHDKAIAEGLLVPRASLGRGGVEYSFMSTSRKKTEAVAYANAGQDGGMPLVFEILMGMVDRGADISWISYFPEEEEILVPPLSSLELAGHPRYEEVVDAQGGTRIVMIVPLNLNSNLKSFTLDQLQQRRKDLHIQTFENLIDEVEIESQTMASDVDLGGKVVRLSGGTGSPLAVRRGEGSKAISEDDFISYRELVLDQCRAAWVADQKCDKKDFNDDKKYKGFLDHALATKVNAKRKLQVLLCGHVLEIPNALDRLKNTSLEDFSVDYQYYPWLCGLQDEVFPWKAICNSLWEAREVVVEKRTSDFLQHTKTPFQLRVILQCVSDHNEAVQSVIYGSFVLDQRTIGDKDRMARRMSQLGSEVVKVACGDLRISQIQAGHPHAGGEVIQLRNCKTPLSHDGGLFIANVVRGSGNPVSIDLSGCKLFSAGSKKLAGALQSAGASLTSLDLSKCAMGLKGGEAVLSALSTATGLVRLALRNNVLSDGGWSALSACLRAARGMQSLDAAYCCLCQGPDTDFAAALQGLSELHTLDLRGSIMLPDMGRDIALVIGHLPALKLVNDLHIGQGESVDQWQDERLCAFGQVDGGLIAGLVEANTELRRLVNLVQGDDPEWDVTQSLAAWSRSDIPSAFLVNQSHFQGTTIKIDGTDYEAPVDREELQAQVQKVIDNSIRVQTTGKDKPSHAQRRKEIEAAAAKNDCERVGQLHAAEALLSAEGDHVFDFRYGPNRLLVQAALSGGTEVCHALIARTEKQHVDDSDMEGRTSLMRAARDGREAVVRTLIMQGATVNAEDSEGRTALHMASGRGWDNVVEILLACKADIGQCSKEGWNALHSAAMYASDRTVITLLEHATEGKHEKAVRKAGERNGNTPLHHAAQYGKQRLVCTLLKAKAHAECKSKSHRTPLMEAAACGNTFVVESLLDNGAIVQSADRRGMTALMEASKRGHADLIRRLSVDSPTQTSESGRRLQREATVVLSPPLHRGSSVPTHMGERSLAAGTPVRLEQGRSFRWKEGALCVNRQDEQGWTALMVAVHHNKVKVVKELLELPDIDVNLAQNEGRTALLLAASNGLRTDDKDRRYVVELLVEKKANVNARDKKGRTSLMEGARSGHYDVVEKLLALKADPNVKSKGDWTCLMFASDKGHAAVVDVLLAQKEVNVDVIGKDGRTAHDLAVRKGHDKVAKKLLAVADEERESPFENGMVIVPNEVPDFFLQYLTPRDKHDLMHNRGQAISFKLDTKVFEVEDLQEVFASLKRSPGPFPSSYEMLSSPLCAVTLKEGPGIPRDACYFSFVYPTTLLDHDEATTTVENTETTSADEFLIFLHVGGFVYYNSTYDIVRANAVAVNNQQVVPEGAFAFHVHLPMQSTSVQYLERWNRWTPVTVEFLRGKGFVQFAWINPGEVLSDSYINPHGGFAYKHSDGSAVFYPVCLDGDGNILPGPPAPFTVKADGTSEEDESDDSSHRTDQGTLKQHSDAADSFEKSPSRASSAVSEGEGTPSASRYRSRSIQTGVTGLLEVRTEVIEKIHHHLLTFAKQEQEKHGGSDGGSGRESIKKFSVDAPDTWTTQDVPVASEQDTPVEKEETLLRLARMHACLPLDKQLRMPMPVNLLPIKGFGPLGDTPIADHLFAEDLHTLNRSRRKRIILYLNREVLELVSERTKHFLLKSQSVRNLEVLLDAETGSSLPRETTPTQAPLKYFKLVGSPLNQVTLPEDVQVRAGIPKEAKFYCFCYPLLHGRVPDVKASQRRSPTDALGCFLRLGGFLYFNAMYEVVSITALSVSAADKAETRCVLHLGPSLPLPRTAVDPLEKAQRWWPVTHKAAARIGYTHMCYIRPCEVLADHVFRGHGGFAYRAASSAKAHFFPVMQSFYDIDYGEERSYRAQYEPRKFQMWIDPREDTVISRARILRFYRHVIPKPVSEATRAAGGRRGGTERSARRGENGASEGAGVRPRTARSGSQDSWMKEESARMDEAYDGDDDDASGPAAAELLAAQAQAQAQAQARRPTPTKSFVEALPEQQELPTTETSAENIVEVIRAEVSVGREGTCCLSLLDGYELQRLMERSEASMAALSLGEVAALRVYGCDCKPAKTELRSASGGGMWRVTRALLLSGVQKVQHLSAVCTRIGRNGLDPTLDLASTPNLPAGSSRLGIKAGGRNMNFFATDYCWAWKEVPGVPNLGTSALPREEGGVSNDADLHPEFRHEWTEMQCLSATKELEIAASMVQADGSVLCSPTSTPVLLRIKVSRADETGADIGWLSAFPREQEVVFPAGTIFAPLFAQRLSIRRSPNTLAFVLTCQPQLPQTATSRPRTPTTTSTGAQHEAIPRAVTQRLESQGQHRVSFPEDAEDAPSLPTLTNPTMLFIA